MSNYLAIDLGASSYRFILGDDKLNLKEISRYSDHLIEINNIKYWDVDKVFNNIIRELKLLKEKNIQLTSISIDSWGCDFMQYDKNHIKYAYSYLNGVSETDESNVFKIIRPEKLFELSGIKNQSFNTIFRYDKIEHKLMFVPSYLQYLLTGLLYTDYTIASTSGFFDKNDNKFNNEIVEKLNISEFIPELIAPMSMKKKLIIEGLTDIEMCFGASHDTACAFYTIPEKSCLINLGSWTIIGCGSNNIKEFNQNFSYERAAKTKYKIVQNLLGMNIFNKILNDLKIEDSFDVLQDRMHKYTLDYTIAFDEFSLAIDYNEMCQRKGLDKYNKYEFLNIYMNSLTGKIKDVVSDLMYVVSDEILSIYIIGGGSSNDYLMKLLDRSLPFKIVKGSSEATALGNILIQKEMNYGNIEK